MFVGSLRGAWKLVIVKSRLMLAALAAVARSQTGREITIYVVDESMQAVEGAVFQASGEDEKLRECKTG